MYSTRSPADVCALMFGEHYSRCCGEAETDLGRDWSLPFVRYKVLWDSCRGWGLEVCLLPGTVGMYSEVTRNLILRTVVSCL